MALNSLYCADVWLINYSLSYSSDKQITDVRDMLPSNDSQRVSHKLVYPLMASSVFFNIDNRSGLHAKCVSGKPAGNNECVVIPSASIVTLDCNVVNAKDPLNRWHLKHRSIFHKLL